MTPDTWTAIIAGATFLVFWTATMLSGGVWLSTKFTKLEHQMLSIFSTHEKEDNRRFERIYQILMHRRLLNQPEFPDTIMTDEFDGR